jgi:hypothetical protein
MKEYEELKNFHYFYLLFMIFWIILKLNTSLLSRGKIVKDRKKILDFFWKNYFFQDFLSILGLILNIKF